MSCFVITCYRMLSYSLLVHDLRVCSYYREHLKNHRVYLNYLSSLSLTFLPSPPLPFPPLFHVRQLHEQFDILSALNILELFFCKGENSWFKTSLLIITFPYNPSCYFSADESTPIAAHLNSFFKWEFMSLYAKIKGCYISAFPLSTSSVI